MLSVSDGEEDDTTRRAVSVGIVDDWEIELFADVLKELEAAGVVERTSWGWKRKTTKRSNDARNE